MRMNSDTAERLVLSIEAVPGWKCDRERSAVMEKVIIFQLDLSEGLLLVNDS